MKSTFGKKKRYPDFEKLKMRIQLSAEKRVQEAKKVSQICKEEKQDTVRR